MRDPELVARAQRAATRLEAAWERWRAQEGLADTPAQPVVGYVGYALREPWDLPRAVIGFSADEAERLAEHLEHGTATVPPQPAPQTARSSAAKTGQSSVQQWSGSPKGRSTRRPRSAESQQAKPKAEAPPGKGSKSQSAQQRPAAEQEAELSADRTLPVIDTVLRVAPASCQEPMQSLWGAEELPPHPTCVWARDGQAPARAQTPPTGDPRGWRASPGRCSTCSGWRRPGSSSGTQGNPARSPPCSG